MPVALYLTASAAAFRDTLEAAQAYGDVGVTDTSTGCRLSGGGTALDVELVTDAHAAVARTLEAYFDLVIIDARPIGASVVVAERLVDDFLDGVRGERDRERRFRRDRVLVLVGGADDFRFEHFLFSLGQRRVLSFVRDRGRGDEARKAFFGELWQRSRGALTPPPSRKALCAAGGGITGVYYELGVLKCFADSFGGFDLAAFDLFFGISAGAIVSSLIANRVPVEELIQKMDPSNRDGFDLQIGLPQLNLRDIPRRLRTTLDHLRRYAARVAAREEPWSLTAAGSQLAALIGPIFHSGDKERQLREIFTQDGRTNDFRALGHALHIGATDQDLREHVLFGDEPYRHVPISQAVAASAAIHPFLAPVEIEGRTYTDGFVTRTTNIVPAVMRGANLVFIIDPFLPLISDQPGFNAAHSAFWVLVQDYKTVAYTRYEQVSSALLETHPAVSCYAFLPSNRMRQLLASNPISTANFDAIVTQAYTSTYRRLHRMAYKLAPDLRDHGITLDLREAERRTAMIDALSAPSARVLES